MLVLLKKLLCNKSVAINFAVSFSICIQAAWKNRTCHVSMQNQRRKSNSTQKRIFAGCINCVSTRKGTKFHATCIQEDLNHYQTERGNSKAQNNIYLFPSLQSKLSLLKVSVRQLLSSAIITWNATDTNPNTTPPKAEIQHCCHL